MLKCKVTLRWKNERIFDKKLIHMVTAYYRKYFLTNAYQNDKVFFPVQVVNHIKIKYLIMLGIMLEIDLLMNTLLNFGFAKI